jgi:hypothetical protein
MRYKIIRFFILRYIKNAEKWIQVNQKPPLNIHPFNLISIFCLIYWFYTFIIYYDLQDFIGRLLGFILRSFFYFCVFLCNYLTSKKDVFIELWNYCKDKTYTIPINEDAVIPVIVVIILIAIFLLLVLKIKEISFVKQTNLKIQIIILKFILSSLKIFLKYWYLFLDTLIRSYFTFLFLIIIPIGYCGELFADFLETRLGKRIILEFKLTFNWNNFDAVFNRNARILISLGLFTVHFYYYVLDYYFHR